MTHVKTQDKHYKIIFKTTDNVHNNHRLEAQEGPLKEGQIIKDG